MLIETKLKCDKCGVNLNINGKRGLPSVTQMKTFYICPKCKKEFVEDRKIKLFYEIKENE